MLDDDESGEMNAGVSRSSRLIVCALKQNGEEISRDLAYCRQRML